MTESDLKYLPFTQVKDILEEKPAVQARSARISPDPQQRRVDQFSEVGVKVQARVVERVKQTVAPDIEFEGQHIAKFSKRTFREHSKLMQLYKTD